MIRTMKSLPDDIKDLAASQHGCFTTRQSLLVGVDARTLVELKRADVIDNPMRGLYRTTEMIDGDSVANHRQLMHGTRLLYPDAVFASVSGVIAHEVTTWGCALTKPVIRRPINRGRGNQGVIVRRRARDTVMTPFGAAVPLATALVELAIDAGTQVGIVSANSALHEGKLTDADLADAIAEMTDWPRAGRAKAMGKMAEQKCESVAESRAMFHFLTHGIPVQPQVEIFDKGRLVGRADFQIVGTKVLIEVDGKVKYADGASSVLWREKLREDALRALGYRVVRVTWEDIEKPVRLLAKIRQALEFDAA